MPFGRLHDLTTLMGLVPRSFTKTHAVGSLASLNPFAVQRRYPGAGGGNPMDLNAGSTWEEAEVAIALAQQVVTSVESDLAGAGLKA